MSERAPVPKRVLVTGSTGAVGEPLAQYLLQRGHYVRGFARRPSPGLEDYVMGDLNDQAKVREAVEGMDTIVHLGAYPNAADFMDVLLQPNVVGLYYICEAAVEFGVNRLVLASTVQVISGHSGKAGTIRVEDGPAPVNHYALTKAWAEVAGDMYARVHNLSVISVRIGWLPRNNGEARNLAKSAIGPNIFFSHNDSNRFHALCVESPNPPPGQSVILQATSRPVEYERMDLGPARRVIGYEPQDTWPDGLPFEVNLDD
ncbi:MAG: NAD(P)-dependent oxidoreductase [Caldilineaceae bacterium]|nr:NAD(P)-dependent oxidoreductase [Caldilineaceae bacterium]